MSRKLENSESSLLRPGAEAPLIRQRLKILVADDNEINRCLVSHLLRAKGHTVILVVDGQEAVDAATADRFDLILMDLQMPEMNGFDATAAIRNLEDIRSSQSRIIALTASETSGNRARCLDAGFDEYLSKPIRAHELFGAIDRVMSERPDRSQLGDSANLVNQSENQVNREVILASVSGDLVLLAKIVQLFLKHYPKVLIELQNALETDDAASLARTAHSLKGASGALLTASASSTVLELEEMAKAGLTRTAAPVLAQLEELLHQNAELLTKLVLSMNECNRLRVTG